MKTFFIILKYTSAVSALAAISLCACEFNQTQCAIPSSRIHKRFIDNDVLIDLYKKAYELTIKQGKPLCNFEQFKELYAEYDLDDDSFIKEIVRLSNETTNNSCIDFYSSSIASYILKDNIDYSSTPASSFRDGFIPDYTMFDYSNVEVGDLLIEFKGAVGALTGHVAVVVDVHKSSFNGNKYIQTIESVNGAGVTFGYYDDMRIVNYNTTLYKPKVALTRDQQERIKYFAKSQLGDDYSFNYGDKKTDFNAESWYCSELVYAAYNYAGYNLHNMDRVWRDDFVESEDFVKTPLIRKIDLSIWNCGGSFVGWSIGIRNNNSVDTQIDYNTKMCFTNDASSRSNLNDLKTITVASNSTAAVSIGFNWFADAIALSYKSGKNRFIMYGNMLDGTISSMMTYYLMLPYEK